MSISYNTLAEMRMITEMGRLAGHGDARLTDNPFEGWRARDWSAGFWAGRGERASEERKAAIIAEHTAAKAAEEEPNVNS